MSMVDLHAAYALISKHLDLAKFRGPRPESLIRSAEAALGIGFPPTYRDFVSRLASGRFGPDEFYGLEDERFEHPHGMDAVARTLHDRGKYGLSNNLIAIYEPGDGSVYTLDSSRPDKHGEYPVVEWDGPESDRVIIAQDFGAFFLMIVREVLTDEGRGQRAV